MQEEVKKKRGRPPIANDQRRATYESSLWEFAQYINPHYAYGDVHEEVFNWLSGDKAASNQLLLMPRGHLKSHCIAVWAVWQITRDPTSTIVYLSAGEDLAKSQIYAIKNMFECEKYRKLWPNMLPDEEGRREKWSAWEFNIEHPLRKEHGIRDSTMIVKTVKSNAIGLHCSHLILDDVVVPRFAYSEVGRKEVSQAISQFASILNPDGVTKAVGTRYHPADAYAAMIDAKYEVFNDEGEPVDEVPLWDVKQYVTEDVGDGSGNYLWPRVKSAITKKWYGFDQATLSKIKAKYKSTGEVSQFWAQYYNDPNDPDANRVDRSKFQYYDKALLRKEGGAWRYKDKVLNVYAGMDIAWSTGKRSDYTAVVVIGVDCDGYIFVLDMIRFKTNKYSEYYDKLLALHSYWDFKKVRIETNAGGALVVAQIRELMRKNGTIMNIDAKHKTAHDGKKQERHAQLVEPRYDSGMVYHYRGGLTQDLEEEVVLERPPHDDLEDSLCAALEIMVLPGKAASNRFSESNVVRFRGNSRFGGARR
jgi:phage terminase large subunit-like protein